MSSPTLIAPRIFALALLVTLGLSILARAQAPAAGGRGGAPAAPPPRPELRAFAAAEGRWAWIKDTGGQSELFIGGPSGTGRLRAKGSGWTEVALDGATVWLLSRSGPAGTLLSLPVEGDAPPAEAARSADQPGALLAQGGQVFWLELSKAADPGMAFVPPLGARLKLRCREASGTLRTLVDRPAVDGAAPGAGDLLAAAAGPLYLRLRSASGTELLSVPLQGGATTWIAGESGTQQAVLTNGTLVWTAPSEEAMPESGIRCLRRLRTGGAPETVADWLPGIGDLAAADEGLRYSDGSNLFSLPARFGSPTFVRKVDFGRLVSDGHSLVILGADQPRSLSARSSHP